MRSMFALACGVVYCAWVQKDNIFAQDAQMPVLSSWMLGAYTSMLGRLSAATAALEAAEASNLTSDSDSESDRSSYTL